MQLCLLLDVAYSKMDENQKDKNGKYYDWMFPSGQDSEQTDVFPQTFQNVTDLVCFI